MRKRILCFCVMLAMLAMTGFTLFYLHSAGYRVNRSASLPGTVYCLTPLDASEILMRGDCVAIDLSRFRNPVIEQGVERGYVNMREPMLKRIGALPGDRVAIAGQRFTVNEDFATAVPTHIASADSYGGALSAWPTPLTLSPDHFWLVSDPQRGFDSRYFGPLERRFFTHRAKFIF